MHSTFGACNPWAALMLMRVRTRCARSSSGPKRAFSAASPSILRRMSRMIPAKSRPQELELAPGALELMSVGIAAHHDGGALGQAQIALAQRHTVALGEPDELGDGPMHQPRVGRMRNGLWLHRGIDRHPLQVVGTD